MQHNCAMSMLIHRWWFCPESEASRHRRKSHSLRPRPWWPWQPKGHRPAPWKRSQRSKCISGLESWKIGAARDFSTGLLHSWWHVILLLGKKSKVAWQLLRLSGVWCYISLICDSVFSFLLQLGVEISKMPCWIMVGYPPSPAKLPRQEMSAPGMEKIAMGSPKMDSALIQRKIWENPWKIMEHLRRWWFLEWFLEWFWKNITWLTWRFTDFLKALEYYQTSWFFPIVRCLW